MGYPASSLHLDRWRYHRGAGQFPAVLSIAPDGRVAEIQFERDRD